MLADPTKVCVGNVLVASQARASPHCAAMKDAPTLSMGTRLAFGLEQWEFLFRLVLISERTPASRYVKHPLVVFSVSSFLGHVLAFGGPVPEFLGGGGGGHSVPSHTPHAGHVRPTSDHHAPRAYFLRRASTAAAEWPKRRTASARRLSLTPNFFLPYANS